MSNLLFNLPTFVLLLRFVYATEASDMLFMGQSLSGNQTIVSKGGIYEFGFFKPGKSHSWYAGIWYTFSEETVVWVANREVPVSDPSSSEITIHTDGNLVMFSNSMIIWSSNISLKNPNDSVVALEDNGNLILKQLVDSTTVIWQSFDHPTDTWLAGATMSRNKITGELKKLTPWKSYDDPAPGPFSFGLDSDGSLQFVLKWNDNVTYWRSGNWTGWYFSGLPEMSPGGSGGQTTSLRAQYNFFFTEDRKMDYFIFNASDSTSLVRTRLFLDFTGQIKVTSWVSRSKQWLTFWFRPNNHCEVYSLCGAFGLCSEKTLPLSPCSCLDGFQPAYPSSWEFGGWISGCSRKHQLQCENGTTSSGGKDNFRSLQWLSFPENFHHLEVKHAKACESACASNCSCTSYAYINGDCYIWLGDLWNIRQLSSGYENNKTLYLKVAAIEMKGSDRANNQVATTIAALVILCLLGALFLFLGLYWIWQKKKKANETPPVVDNSLVLFKYQQLEAATKKFSEVIGIGGFGTVFKGALPDSTEVAIKKINDIHQGEKQFRAEVSTLATVQHVNLVRLRGFCPNGPHGLLVYDFMPNGSLSTNIFNTNAPVMGWKRRYNILIGIARGIAYLHEECRQCILHCDIKPENILLDMDFCPKVADFGLAKLIGRDFSRVLTTMRGTIGYLAPEWILGMAITPKSDVYSFGMMLFEIISGKRNMEQGGNSLLFYPVWAATKVTENELLELLDPRLDGDVHMDELKRACRVACWCIQDCEFDRPSMGRIVQMLEGVVDVRMPPVPRLLQHLSQDNKNMFFSELSSAPLSQR